MAKKVLFIIASEGFQPLEYGVPVQILKDENVQVVTASDEPGEAVSSDESTVKVDLTIDQVNVDDYDGIFVVGGPGAMQHLDNERVYRIIRDVDRALDKIYGAICISTRILAHAGVLDGRTVTGWDGDGKLKGILKEYGANYVGENVVVDRNLITATGPKAADEFGKAILKALYTPQGV